MTTKQRSIVDADAILREAEEANAALEDQVQDPFGGDSVSIEVTKEVNLAQFDRELEQEAGRAVEVALAVPGGFGAVASQEEPGTLFAKPKMVGQEALQRVYEAHTAEPEPEPEQPQAPSGEQGGTFGVEMTEEGSAAIRKAAEGKTLTTKEISSALAMFAPLTEQPPPE